MDSQAEISTCRVWIAIVDSDRSLDEISQLTGLTPTRSIEKGAPTKSGSKFSVRRWEMLVPVANDEPLISHMTALVDLLSQEARVALQRLADAAIVRIEIEIAGGTGILLPHRVLKIVSECGADIDIDVLEA